MDASIIPRHLFLFQMFTINYSCVQAVVGEVDVAVDSCSNDESCITKLIQVFRILVLRGIGKIALF